MVHFVLRLRSDQSLKYAVGILQESMKDFVEHSGNVTKCGAVDHIASSFGCCTVLPQGSMPLNSWFLLMPYGLYPGLVRAVLLASRNDIFECLKEIDFHVLAA